YIAYVTTTSVSVVSIDGQNIWRKLLIYDAILTYSEYTITVHPVWSPDSSGMWVAVPPTNNESRMEIYFVPLTGDVRGVGSIEFHSEDGTEVASPLVRWAVPSPNGKYVASSVGDPHSLVIASVNGSQQSIFPPPSIANNNIGFNGWIDDSQFYFREFI